MGMSPRLLRPRQTLHPEALAWQTAVVANGGSVGSSLSAVDKFCKAIDAAGIRDRFYRLNLFCGSGLNACLVPLYRGQSRTGTQYGNTTDTNVGPFVSGDYFETGASGGLAGNGTTKYLNTGFSHINMSESSNHVSAFLVTSQNGKVPVGSDSLGSAVPNRTFYFLQDFQGASTTYFGGHYTAPAGTRSVPSHLLGSRQSTTTTLYNNGSSIGTATGAQTISLSSNFAFYVFGNNVNNSLSNAYGGTISMYSIGLGMSSQQVSAFSSALATFRTAMSRA